MAATIALMRQANPSLTPAQIRAILTRTATVIPGGERAVGAGVLNPELAVQAALEA